MSTATINVDTPYELTQEQIEYFQSNGYIKLKTVFSAEELAYFEEEITQLVEDASQEKEDLDKRDTYGKAFLQIFNLWKQGERTKQFVFGKRLAKLASDLMGVNGVRLYHDQALFKEPSGGFTPWHVDQYYWPMTTENSITAWVPLQEVPMELGPLEFSKGSQKIKFGREFNISEESEAKIQENLKRSDYPVDSSPFDLGEVSFHYGFTFHRAGPNTTGKVRKVMTVIYMEKDMILKDPANQAEKTDWEMWCKGAEIGKIIDTPDNPVLYAQQ